jgi:DNA modification methylase
MKYKLDIEKTNQIDPKAMSEQLPLFYEEKSFRRNLDNDSNSHSQTNLSGRFRDQSFDYKSADTSWGVHGIHPYPAMMIYPVARRLLLEFSQERDIVLDPFMGSGTVLVESLLHSRRAYGVDINPLALLLAQVKTTPVRKSQLIAAVQEITHSPYKVNYKRPDFFNIDYWFKERVIDDLSVLLAKIEEINDFRVKNFFKIAYSETVRFASNTCNGEFKLLRKKDIESHNPNVFTLFKKISFRNIAKLSETYKNPPKTWVKILDKDTRERIPIEPDSVSLILTSPPYGDSKTTVAYGQFSRLSLQWLGYEKVNIDRESLGGKPCKDLSNNLPSNTLQRIVQRIGEKDEKRAREVLSFYVDLQLCFNNFRPLLKPNGFFCAVVGNRRVKQVTIPTDVIIAELCEDLGFSHIKTVVRSIPNKRMPKLNSPTNVEGVVESTMNEESIVVMKKTDN